MRFFLTNVPYSVHPYLYLFSTKLAGNYKKTAINYNNNIFLNYATFKTNELWDKLLSFLSWHHLFRPSGVKIPLAPYPARSLPTLPKKMKGHSVDVRGGRPSSGLVFVNSKLNYPNLKYFSSSPFPLVFFSRGEKFCMPDAAALIQLWDLVLVTSSKLGRAAEKVVPINPVCRANALLFCSDEDFCQHANWCSGGGWFSTIFWTWNYFYLWEFVFFCFFMSSDLKLFCATILRMNWHDWRHDISSLCWEAVHKPRGHVFFKC